MRAVEIDDAFVDLIDCPKVVAATEHVLVGRPDGTEFADIARKDSDSGDTDVWQGNRGVVRCLGGGPRTYPSDPDGEGYTYWHRSALCPRGSTGRDLSAAAVGRDEEKPSAWPFPRGRTIKLFFALSDVAEDGGPL